VELGAGNLDLAKRAHLELAQFLEGQLRAFGQKLLVFVRQVFGELVALKQLVDSLVALVFKDASLIVQVLQKLFFFGAFDRERALVFLCALSREDLHVHDRSVDARRAGQACVANVAGLLAEYRSKQFLFGGKLGFALGRDFADQDRARLDARADSNDSRVVEISKRRLADVRNIASDFLRSELRIARLDFKLFDVNRSERVFLDQFLRNQNRVLEVVPAPRHERDK